MKTHRKSFLILRACTEKESVTKGKRGEKGLKGDEWKGTQGPPTSVQLQKEAETPALQEEPQKQTPTPNPMSLETGCH